MFTTEYMYIHTLCLGEKKTWLDLRASSKNFKIKVSRNIPHWAIFVKCIFLGSELSALSLSVWSNTSHESMAQNIHYGRSYVTLMKSFNTKKKALYIYVQCVTMKLSKNRFNWIPEQIVKITNSAVMQRRKKIVNAIGENIKNCIVNLVSINNFQRLCSSDKKKRCTRIVISVK